MTISESVHWRSRKAVAACWRNRPANARNPRLCVGPVLSFDKVAALVSACLVAEGKAKGRPARRLDPMIAAAAGADGCLVVTR